MEDTGMDDVCHYENLRKRNLEDNKAVLAKLMCDIKDQIVKKPTTVQKRKRISAADAEDQFIRRNPSRRARVTPSRFDLPRTRSRARSGSISSTVSSASSSSTTPSSSPEKLVVRFGFFKRLNTESSGLPMDESSDEEDAEDCPLPQITRKPRTVREARPVEDITQADLDMVAVSVSDKKYDSIYGSTCHQCRQKTNDMKTICRSEDCTGVRGQFCGPCLKNRYGEDAKAALMSPDWVCPPCRKICNCSFCRRKNGKASTGILIHLARERGYCDVNSFLNGLKNTTD
ncbi:cell division cycle-associated 7-like protein [Aplysia californica]|uniref:Cell division cycle-associated 7-like protein n=1 Tax=Aplysia californica TaxID=6500 RepID=A0ABM0K5D7_APLCA|nr:cell division cycle-associated 7-like protein [Aplysia californica]XP_005109142.1 cell division cycle-associated 7-like protein [Aplysia californica]XP_005109143.1 cell division cycle-associated 7-like protein [Aplysia californica]XP_005109144.1 cell division cycle-associated 7-like protein [Aplysia californica]XP_005109145.1 cell division cycle-associated 7-like protein [Aplysia californica]XP_005109146.1 cell division cycle-associated 7-like protein [Aplysia californica]